MIGERVALLVGLILVPAILLWVGHEFRNLSLRTKRIFWGGVIGHGVALLFTLIIMVTPPVWWHGGSIWRDLAVHWSLLFGAVLGAAVGAFLGRRGPMEREPRSKARAGDL